MRVSFHWALHHTLEMNWSGRRDEFSVVAYQFKKRIKSTLHIYLVTHEYLTFWISKQIDMRAKNQICVKSLAYQDLNWGKITSHCEWRKSLNVFHFCLFHILDHVLFTIRIILEKLKKTHVINSDSDDFIDSFALILQYLLFNCWFYQNRILSKIFSFSKM